MNTLGVFVAAGAVSWVLRASFILGLRSRESATRIEPVVRQAAPAALAALVATSLVSIADHSRHGAWPLALAAGAAVLVARRTRNLTLVILAGAGVLGVSTAL